MDSMTLKVGDVVFCGDAAMSGFPSMHKITIWVESVEGYVLSWKTLVSSGVRTLYPGHGSSFDAAQLTRNMGSREEGQAQEASIACSV